MSKIERAVEARYRGGSHYYKGVITGEFYNKDVIIYDINYNDGDKETNVTADKVKVV